MNLKSIKLVLPLLLLGSQVAFGQLAAKKAVTQEELYKHLNGLFQKGTDESKAELVKEAEFLAKSKKETDQLLAGQIYTGLQKADKADAIKVGIAKKFPKGITVRNEAFGKLFKADNQTAAQMEEQYNALIKKFPENSYDDKNNGIYGYGMGAVAQQYAKEKNLDRVSYYLDLLRSKDNYVHVVFAIGRELNQQKQYTFSQSILEPVYTNLNQLKSEGKKSAGGQYIGAISLQYADALMGNGQVDKALEILAKVHTASPSETATIAYAKALQAKGRDLDAFQLIETEVIKEGKEPKLLETLLPLYSKLNNGLSDTTTYLKELNGRIDEMLVTKLKAEMVKKEAPQFSLVDRSGNEVSLAGLKGKVVVLDFWATWCGPCKMSFPGMQAAVNKYANDQEVVFLFINTWQKEENYKELVNNFINDNKYSFHVLYDEMKEKDKSVVSAYGVGGIPTKVVIDKDGFIRFQSSGSGSDVEKIVNEMSNKIELAKKG
ncbi:TlpA disulfide reductase family protein [Sphingobacterium sp.]|uniref:TlpA disulfide reductase family protein n=1 Tax=Sphingobacterium sp. TaxID=341027 RepID=UPI0028A0B38A|nr:TlpA disulfide reductase family protein [Sphingobacterium sp.]